MEFSSYELLFGINFLVINQFQFVRRHWLVANSLENQSVPGFFKLKVVSSEN